MIVPSSDRTVQAGVATRIIGALAEQRRSQNWLAGEVGVPQSTFSRQLKDGSLALETVVAAAGVLGVPVAWLLSGEEPAGEVREWADDMVHIVRHAHGERPMSPEEHRLFQIDMSEGMIRQGRKEGRDVRKLEAFQRELRQAGAPVQPPIPLAPDPETAGELSRWVDEVNRLEVPEGLKIMKLDALAATIRAEMARQDAEASKIRARAIDSAEAAADARARTVQQAEDTAAARARAVRGAAKRGWEFSELSEVEAQMVDIARQEIERDRAATPPVGPLPAAPESRPEVRRG